MLPRFLKLTRWLSIPIFIICVAIAVRAPFLWSNHLNYDYFHLGRYLGRSPQQGASVLNIGLFGTACDWFICDPGHVRGRMYIHHIQRGITTMGFSSSSPTYTITTHGCYLVRWQNYSLNGTTMHTHY